MYHGTTYSRAKSIVAEGWIYRTNGNRAVYRNTEPGFVSLAARPIEAAEFAARAYLNERLHNGTQKLVVFEVDVNANTVALDKKETDNPSTEWAVRHPEQTGPYYRCDTDLPRWCVTRWLLLQFVSPQDRWDFIDERIELKDAGLADQQWRRSLSALQKNSAGTVPALFWSESMRFLLSRYFCRPWWLSCAGRGSKYVCGYGCCLV